MSAFGDSLIALGERVGSGDLTGSVTFGPHPAAVPLHEHPSRFSPPSWAGHPTLNYTKAGSTVRYLADPLLAEYPRYLQGIADGLYDEGPRRGMERAMDDLLDKAERRIPEDTSALRSTGRSGVDG